MIILEQIEVENKDYYRSQFSLHFDKDTHKP